MRRKQRRCRLAASGNRGGLGPPNTSRGAHLRCARPPPPLAAFVDHQQRGPEAGLVGKVADCLPLTPLALHI
jgi:hypothetical protein